MSELGQGLKRRCGPNTPFDAKEELETPAPIWRRGTTPASSCAEGYFFSSSHELLGGEILERAIPVRQPRRLFIGNRHRAERVCGMGIPVVFGA
jgi:hypothetical protein